MYINNLMYFRGSWRQFLFTQRGSGKPKTTNPLHWLLGRELGLRFPSAQGLPWEGNFLAPCGIRQAGLGHFLAF